MPRKEGDLKEDYATFDEFVPSNQQNVMLLDANLLASRNAFAMLEEMIRRNYRVNFSQTLDISYLTDDVVSLLLQIQSVNSRFSKPMYYFSCNSLAQASLPLLKARYRYNNKHMLDRYLRNKPALVTRIKHKHFGGRRLL